MGKTSFALGILSHVGIDLGPPALLFSLEMGHLELTQRLLASEAKVDAQQLRLARSGNRTGTRIGRAVTRLSGSSIFIDDNPNLSVHDIRARARRLKKAEGDLGVVIVDYIQLMTGRARAENRQVEVAEISRSLKILARELEVPVVALPSSPGTSRPAKTSARCSRTCANRVLSNKTPTWSCSSTGNLSTTPTYRSTDVTTPR